MLLSCLEIQSQSQLGLPPLSRFVQRSYRILQSTTSRKGLLNWSSVTLASVDLLTFQTCVISEREQLHCFWTRLGHRGSLQYPSLSGRSPQYSFPLAASASFPPSPASMSSTSGTSQQSSLGLENAASPSPQCSPRQRNTKEC